MRNNEIIGILLGGEIVKENSLVVSWQITQACNLDCFYCYGSRREAGVCSVPVKEVIGCLKNTNKDCLVVLVGGEVFIIPNFVDICKQLIDADIMVSIETNLSLTSAIIEFANRINPVKIGCIYVSTHILEREKNGTKEEYIRNVILLKEKGFKVRVNYVLHPSLLNRFDSDYEFFKTKGIELLPRPFVGLYKKLFYPDAYSRKERALILSVNPDAGREASLKGTKGILCNAGRSFIKINENGMISRCAGDCTRVGDVHHGVNLFEGPRPCPNKTCPCWGWGFIADSKARDRLGESFIKPSLRSQIKRYCYENNRWGI